MERIVERSASSSLESLPQTAGPALTTWRHKSHPSLTTISIKDPNAKHRETAFRGNFRKLSQEQKRKISHFQISMQGNHWMSVYSTT